MFFYKTHKDKDYKYSYLHKIIVSIFINLMVFYHSFSKKSILNTTMWIKKNNLNTQNELNEIAISKLHSIKIIWNLQAKIQNVIFSLAWREKKITQYIIICKMGKSSWRTTFMYLLINNIFNITTNRVCIFVTW